MADTPFTLSLTDYQVEVLGWLVRTANAENNTAFTTEQFLQLQFPSVFLPWGLRYEEAMREAVARKYPIADADTKAQVRELLDVA